MIRMQEGVMPLTQEMVRRFANEIGLRYWHMTCLLVIHDPFVNGTRFPLLVRIFVNGTSFPLLVRIFVIDT